MKFSTLTAGDREKWQKQILKLEEHTFYPLGEDAFSLSHGNDYFAFFDRLGKVHYFVIHQEQEIAGVGCAILRAIPGGKNFWYLCDLKVAPKYRRKKLAIGLFLRKIVRYYFVAPRGFLISMDPSDPEKKAPVLKVIQKIPLLSRDFDTLNIYSLSEKEVHQILPYMRETYGNVGFLSLKGIKDLVLESTGNSLPIFHFQYGPFAQIQFVDPQEGYQHMLCARNEEALDLKLKLFGYEPIGSATVVSHHFKKEWIDFILTSDL